MFLLLLYQQETIKNYQNVLAKDFKDQFIGMNIKQKVKIKIQQMNSDKIKSNFVGVNRLFVLVYTNQGENAKRLNAQKYYLSKGIIKNYNVIINEKNFYDQAVDSDIKRYQEIRKLTTGEGEDYTTECLLNYDYVKSRCSLIAVDLSRQKELDTYPKGI